MTSQRDSGSRGICRNEKGFALVFALVFAFLLTLMALTFQGLGDMEADLVQHQVAHSQALYLAEAGLERAMYNLRMTPAWRGANGDGVAFQGEALSNGSYVVGSYDVLLCDAPNGCEGFCNGPIPAGQVCLSSTGTAGSGVVSSRRRVEARVKVGNSLDIPSFFYLAGEPEDVKLRDDFLIDGHDTDPLTGRGDDDPCKTRHGITSEGDIGEIKEELEDEGTGDQVIGLGDPPSVDQISADQGVDINQLARQIQDASQEESFYHPFTDKEIKTDTTWGSYPNDLWVVRVEGELRVTNKKTLSGAGILIVEDEFKIDNKSTFNWTGLVIVLNEDGEDAGDVELEHKGGGTVYGALLMGGAGGESELDLRPDPFAGGGSRFRYSCDALDAAVSSPSFAKLRKVTTRSWKEVSP